MNNPGFRCTGHTEGEIYTATMKCVKVSLFTIIYPLYKYTR